MRVSYQFKKCPLTLRQISWRAETSVGFLEEALEGDEAEIVSGILRIQQQAEVGGRNPMSDFVDSWPCTLSGISHWSRGGKCAEVSPGPERHATQKIFIVGW